MKGELVFKYRMNMEMSYGEYCNRLKSLIICGK